MMIMVPKRNEKRNMEDPNYDGTIARKQVVGTMCKKEGGGWWSQEGRRRLVGTLERGDHNVYRSGAGTWDRSAA